MGVLWIAKDANFLHADNEDSDQTVRMHRLIGEFIGCTYQKVRFLELRLIVFLHIYRIYPKYSDNSTPYHICSKI